MSKFLSVRVKTGRNKQTIPPQLKIKMKYSKMKGKTVIESM